VSAVGKKLLESNVITEMREIRTPELKELFAGRASLAAAATIASNTTSTASTVTGVVSTTDRTTYKRADRTSGDITTADTTIDSGPVPGTRTQAQLAAKEGSGGDATLTIVLFRASGEKSTRRHALEW
jgi:hypothetical protein